MRKWALLIAASLVMWSGLLGGCSDVAEVVVGGPASGGRGAGGGSIAGAAGTGAIGPTPECAVSGSACDSGAECCSGVCDDTSGRCAGSGAACHAEGESCGDALDCCSLSCQGETCAAACTSDGDDCSDAEECCSGRCTEGSCASLSSACLTAGNGCSDSGECCSGLCKDGACSLASSFCTQKDDICRADADCCTGTCLLEESLGELGVCGDPPPGPSNCSAGVAGTVCDDCNECCSRLCAPFGATGVKICQPAGGCRLTGEVCRGDLDCCGGDPDSDLPGAGNVTCFKEAGAELGICRNAMSCSPQGNVCHYQDYTCSVSAAANKCCDGPGNSGRCQLDQLGVPRCTGFSQGECRAAGETCSSAVDCCEGAPCVADVAGVLRCQGTVCGEAGSSCSVNADCCAGSHCEQVVGSTMGVCSERDPDPPTDECIEFGQICTSDDECCGDVPCEDGRCQYPVK